MVKQSRGLFVCEECLMKFYSKSIAEKCEHSCKTKHCCDLEVIKHAVK